MTSNIYYKYRSLANFKNFVDIILNSRLYAAPYFNLNDPMEGFYSYDEGLINRELIAQIKGEKKKIKICSLSRNPNNTLMWSHYADSHKGVAIGVIVDRKHELRKVTYNGISHVRNAARNGDHETAKNILSCKLEPWSYEEEERVFVTAKYVKVSIKELRLGSKMDNPTKQLIQSLILKIDPKISVIDVNRNNIL
jgi:hypothetical protein